MRMSLAGRALVYLTLLTAPATVRAQFVVHTDLAAFLAATSNRATDTYDGLTLGLGAASAVRSAGPYSYAVHTDFGGLYVVQPDGSPALSSDAPEMLWLSGFTPNVRAVGGFFFGTDFFGVLRPSTMLSFTAANADGSMTHQLTSSAVTSFFGIVSTSPLVSFTVAAAQPASGSDFTYVTIDNLILAAVDPTTSVVPEPSTCVLMASGLIGLAVVRRRRRT